MRHTRSRLPLALCLLSAAPAFSGCGAPVEQPAAHDGVVAPSPAAHTLLTDLRSRFTVALPSREPLHGLPAKPGEEAAPRERAPLLRASQVEAFEQRDGGLVPRLPASARRGLMRPATVRLPARASGAFEVQDDKSGMRIAVQREGATDAAGEVAEGWVAYRGGVKGGDVLHLVHAEGTEDYVYFAEKPTREELRYRVDVSAVAGLRLVSNILEFIDETGHPRLRVTAPMALDARGEALALRIEVAGCAYDESPAAPWQRERVKPGASQCEVAVRWEAAAYPVVVDPAFTSTGSLAVGRANHTASVLPDGRVLVVGGTGNDATACPNGRCKTSETWNAGSFSASGSLAAGRTLHTASVLPDGRVLVVGGYGDDATACPNGRCKTSETWNAGSFSASGSLAVGRTLHTASVLPDGRVLVVGGNGSDATACPGQVCRTSEAWNAGAFSASGSLVVGRYYHTASVLPDGRVLVVGGYGDDATACPNSRCKTSETWNAGSFSASGSLAAGRTLHTASVLPDGRVLVVGGNGTDATACPGQVCRTSEAWNAGAFSASGSLVVGRFSHTASVLPDGRVLVVGGFNNTEATACPGDYCKTSEAWNAGSFSASGSLAVGRRDHTASVLPDGRVLVVGGSAAFGPSGYSKTSEIWDANTSDTGTTCTGDVLCVSGSCRDGFCCDISCSAASTSCAKAKTGLANGVCAPVMNGVTCSNSTQCGSGFCVDNLCCDKACTGLCEACSAAKKGQGLDGVCEPVKTGTDPDNECAIAGVGVCAVPGYCDGTGTCKSNVGAQCAPGSCAGSTSQKNPSLCDAVGSCQAGATTDCYPYVCEGTACRTTCVDDADCASGVSCISGKCAAPQPTGTACSVGAQCQSTFCVEGLCCDSLCDGPCQSCLALNKADGTSSGTCGAVKPDTDPKDKCSPDLSNTCGADGLCDASGSCRQHAKPTKTCGATSCTANGTSVVGKVCDGAGLCINAPDPVPCGNYGCSAGSCLQVCAADADCAQGFVCVGQACVSPLANGQACQADGQCQSKHCVEGVCCDSACDGPCSSCKAELKGGGVSGTCGSVLAGTDPKDKCLADAANPCGADGLCDDKGFCRTAASSNKSCGSTSCSADGLGVQGQLCDGAGTCASAATPTSCGNYRCEAAQCLQSCSSSSQCAPGLTCASGACVTPLVKGEACSAPEQCQSKFCVEGVCCDGPCDGSCQSCVASKKAQGPTGECGNIKENTDPDGECASGDPSAVCPADGMCDGNGACRAHAKPGTACGAGNSCNGNSVVGLVCDDAGKCVNDQQGQSCGKYACKAGSCVSQCTNDDDCAAGNYCEAGSCQAKKAGGDPCQAKGECSTGYCVEGFCCNKACDGKCESCDGSKKASGSSGECGPITAGTDPKNKCGDLKASCVGDELGSPACDGDGACALIKSTCEGNLRCSSASCPATCSADGDCIDGFRCDGATCVKLTAQGKHCGSAGECASGFCADSICCDSPCNQQCASCGEPGNLGKCIAIDGDPREGHPPCDGEGKCKGSCDGKKLDGCSLPEEGTTCQASSCKGDILTPASTCDGAGKCVSKDPTDCGDYACDEAKGACKTSCSVDGDCKAGSVCDMTKKQCAPSPGTCKDAFTARKPDGTETPCSPYRCSNGSCRDSCSGASDCADGYTCKGGVCEEAAGGGGQSQGGAAQGGQAGAAVAMGGQGGATPSQGGASATSPAAEAPAEEGGCGCRTVPARSDGRAALALGLALVAIARRRGSKRRETR